MLVNICVNMFVGSTTVSNSNHPYDDDEMLENMKAYQLDILYNGDVIVYDGIRVVGVIKYHPNCDLHKLIDEDNQ